MWSKIFKSEPPDVTPPGPFCCAAHRAATRLAPLTRAAATDASGLRPPRSAWQPLPLLPLISLSASYHDSSPALSVDCAAQWGAGRDGAVSPVTGRAAAANSQYGAATRRRPPYPRAGARRPLRTPVGDVRQLRGGGLGYGLAGRGLACCSGQSRSFRRFAAGVRWSPARSPSMP